MDKCTRTCASIAIHNQETSGNLKVNKKVLKIMQVNGQTNMNVDSRRAPLFTEVDEKIGILIDERVTKELAQVVSVLKEVAQRFGSSVYTAGGLN